MEIFCISAYNDVMDIQKAAEEIGISVDGYKKLCSLFIKSGRTDCANLRDAIEAMDRVKIKEYAHHIKGAARNLDFETLSSLAKEIEFGAPDEPKEQLLSAYNRLFTSYEDVEMEIKEAL